MNWLSQKIQNVKTAIYIQDSEAIRSQQKCEQVLIPLLDEPISEVTHEMIFKQRTITVMSRFIAITEAHGGQSFLSLEDQSDFDEFKSDIDEFIDDGGYVGQISGDCFLQIKKIK